MKAGQLTTALETVLQDKYRNQFGREIKRNKRFAVVYTRVSSQEQEENNSSLETQLKLCNDYAHREGVIVKKYFGGTYESAKTDVRKEFQMMLTFVKKDKDIAYIIVYNYDRFSRTGPAAAQLSSELAKMGIRVKSVTQDLDNSTPTGKFQENLFHMFNNYDNQQRALRTITNTREIMLKGYWPYAPPLGYRNLKPKHRACDHQYVITEEGKWLKKAFQWKGEGNMSNREIMAKLGAFGVCIKEKNFRWIISNPFYLGYVTGKFVEGKLIKGHHPALVDLKTFMKANDLLQTEPRAGIPKSHKIEELPLKIFARDEVSGSQFTGYEKKNHWYYKTRSGSGRVNINAEKLNNHFRKFLGQFEYNKGYEKKLRKLLAEKIRNRMKQQVEDAVLLKKRLTAIENKLEAMEERYVHGDLSRDLFDKYSAKAKVEIIQIRQKLESGSFDSSNLDSIVTKGIRMAENLSQLWLSADFNGKQKLQYLVFPSGIMYSKEKDRVRTERINSLFAEIPPLTKVLSGNEKGNPRKNCLSSRSVP